MLRDNLQLKSSRNKFGNFHSALPVDLIDGADQKKRSSERPQAISIAARLGRIFTGSRVSGFWSRDEL